MRADSDTLSIALDAALESRTEDATRILTDANITIRQNVLATCGVPQVGDILSCGWGYEQTRYDFYQVVGVTAASVRIRKVTKRCVRGGSTGMHDAHVVPVPGVFASDKVATKRYRKGGWDGTGYSVKISDYSSASLWDGQPEHESGDH